MDEDEIKGFEFFTDEEYLQMSNDIKLAQKRTNKMMQISRLSHAVKVILYKMGYENDKDFRNAELRGDIFDSSLYDAYLVAKYERDAARKKLDQLPPVTAVASMLHLFYYEVQKEDPEFWKEMKERAGLRSAKINQRYNEALKDMP